MRVARDEQQRVTLEATDLDSTAIYQTQTADVGSPGSFLVPFAPLNQLVKSGKEPVRLFGQGKQVGWRTLIGTSPFEQVFDALAVDEFPPTVTVNGPGIPLDAHFRDTLRQALTCCSEDGSRYVIQHVCLDTRDAEGHYLAATDARHLYAANSFHFDLKEPVLIPDRDFLRWNKFMAEGTGTLSVRAKRKQEGPWLAFQAGPWTFLTKTCDEAFPNWKQIVPETNRSSLTLGPDAVSTLLAGVPRLPLTDDYHRGVRLTVDRELTVSARTKDAVDWTSFTVAVTEFTGPPLQISLNREYLLKALRFGLTTVQFSDALSPMVFSAAGRQMVVMPLRPDGAPQVKAAAAPQPAQPAAESSVPSPTNNHNPPEAQPPAQPQETNMPKENPTTETQPTAETSPVKSVIEQIEHIRETLKGVVKEFAQVLDGLKQIEKEKRATDREIASVREKLREIQAVHI